MVIPILQMGTLGAQSKVLCPKAGDADRYPTYSHKKKEFIFNNNMGEKCAPWSIVFRRGGFHLREPALWFGKSCG